MPNHMQLVKRLRCQIPGQQPLNVPPPVLVLRDLPTALAVAGQERALLQLVEHHHFLLTPGR